MFFPKFPPALLASHQISMNLRIKLLGVAAGVMGLESDEAARHLREEMGNDMKQNMITESGCLDPQNPHCGMSHNSYDTVDGSEIRLTSWYDKNPTLFCRVLAPSQVVHYIL